MTAATTPAGPSLLRWLTTGLLSYAGWLLCHLVLLGLFPLLLLIELIAGDTARRAMRRFGAWFLRLFFLHYLPLIGVYRFAELPNRETLTKLGPSVVTANHRSWLDALLVLALFPRARVPVSAGYTRVPLLGRIMRWMGCVSLERHNSAALVQSLTELGAHVAAGGLIVVFPEGKRAKPGETLIFSDVFFRVAVNQGVPVVPLVLHCEEPYLAPGGAHLLTVRKARWTVRLLAKVIPGKRDRAADIARLAQRRIAAELSALDRGLSEGVGPCTKSISA